MHCSDRPIDYVLSTLPVSPEIRTALYGGTFRDVYDALLACERADWDALATAATGLGPIVACVPDCYQSAATRAGAFPS
jgi:hypothetical protein